MSPARRSIKVGFIGLGNMGMPMARSLVKWGLPVTVYDLRQEAVEDMKALGAAAAGSSREVAEASDAVVIIVRDVPQTEEVIFGRDGVWEGMKKGGTIIISSVIGPAYCQKLYNKGKERGIRVIDAAVSDQSGAAHNLDRGMTLMIGGDEDAVKACWPVFEAMSKNIFHFGAIGTGQVCKLVNNMLLFGCRTATSECLNLGLKAGLDLQKMIEAMRLSTGNNWCLQNMDDVMKSPERQSKLPAAGKAPAKGLGTKDRELTMEMAEAIGAKMPLSRFILDELDTSVYEAYSAAMEQYGLASLWRL